jgi:[ribosomal protein S5]-alanine N-acetyltransferase
MRITRLVTPDDDEAIAELLRVNHEFLAPWSPIRDDDYDTVGGQRRDIEAALERHANGTALPHVIVDSGGRIVGRITLSGIVRGPLLSCSVGYWVGEAHNGHGFATRAVAEVKRIAFDELGLHRIQAETLLHNAKSQRVLERNGFVQFGIAPKYLKIAGVWQDNLMYQVLVPDQ